MMSGHGEPWQGRMAGACTRDMAILTLKGKTDRSHPLEIPWDLSEWVERTVLLKWIVADIDLLDWQNPALLEYLAHRPQSQPKMMLQLTTYAYSTGAFGADEVKALFDEDKTFHTLEWIEPPKRRAISRFRRENRGLLKWTLVQVLRQAVDQRFQAEGRLLPGLQRHLLQNAIDRIDLARHSDRAAAED